MRSGDSSNADNINEELIMNKNPKINRTICYSLEASIAGVRVLRRFISSFMRYTLPTFLYMTFCSGWKQCVARLWEYRRNPLLCDDFDCPLYGMGKAVDSFWRARDKESKL